MSNSQENSFSENSFWEKLKNFASQAGKEVVEKALILFYAAQKPETPVWAKSIVYSALAYFILPLDAIPDTIPIAGFTDDLATLAAAIVSITMYITPEVKEAAKNKMLDWFGNDEV
jgi:uncharacterized membrane protein YkvA (DUF1232 family)